MLVRVGDIQAIDIVKAQAERALRPRFADQFTVMTQAQTLGLLSTILGTLTAMLAGLAGISLLVGGIGIMNIMLVSVTETYPRDRHPKGGRRTHLRHPVASS